MPVARRHAIGQSEQAKQLAFNRRHLQQLKAVQLKASAVQAELQRWETSCPHLDGDLPM